MAKYFYNIHTRPNEKKPHQRIIEFSRDDKNFKDMVRFKTDIVTPGDKIYTGPHADDHFIVKDFEEFKEWMLKADFSGDKKFLTDTTLYVIYQESSFQYAPLLANGTRSDEGINWSNYWYFSREAAEIGQENAHREGLRTRDILYHEDLDTYSLQIHNYKD